MSPRPKLDHVRRPEIIAAAAEVIRERGLENARVADIGARAGTSGPGVLYWFQSKDSLLREALVSTEEGFYDDFEREIEELESGRERLMKVIEDGVGQGDIDLALWMELWPRALRDPALARTRAELDARWRRAIADVVRHGQASGEFAVGADPGDVAALLASLLDGLALQVAFQDQDFPLARARGMAMRLAERELGCELMEAA